METQIFNNQKIVVKEWYLAGKVSDFFENEGVAIKYKNIQIAIFYLAEKDEWYATQNLCPHKLEMALSRGLIGDFKGEPKVSCPFHKKSFSLKTGKCLSGDDYIIDIFPVKVKDGSVYVGIPEPL